MDKEPLYGQIGEIGLIPVHKRVSTGQNLSQRGQSLLWHDPEVISLWEEQMAFEGERIYQRRDAFVRELTPIFQRYYERISGNREQVAIEYISHCQRGPLLEVIQRDRAKDRIMGYSLHGAHRDDLVFTLGAGEEFGQIFITDTNRSHLDQILAASSHDYKIFHVDAGEINE